VSDIERAVAVLRDGGLVAFPTETVYGLGADAANPEAMRRLYEVKRRPADHPVITHVPEHADLAAYGLVVPELATRLARKFWPGPLTLVVRRAGSDATVAVRVPAHPIALALLGAFDGGIAAPSANRFGCVSPTRVEHVRADLGSDVDFVLDGGPCAVGVESTIVDVSGPEPQILRVGGITDAQLEVVAGRPLRRRTEGEVAAPGTMASHYSPRAQVEVVAESELEARAAQHAAAGRPVAVLALADAIANVNFVQATVLDPPADVDEYARVLYARLREADSQGVDILLVVAPPQAGLGAAVGDRLRRAAAG